MANPQRIPQVEHRSVWTLHKAELNLFETTDEAYRFKLAFQDTVMTSMVTGRKVMHLQDQSPFPFVPGEALLLPAYKPMEIDFPEASLDSPTQCLALTISGEFIQDTVDRLNHYLPKVETGDTWDLNVQNYHFEQSAETHQVLGRLLKIFRENHVAKERFASNALEELMLRVMQTQARHILLDQCKQYSSSHRLAWVVEYIRENLGENISVETLCDKACLSQAQFYRAFKQELGMSPTEFVNRERIRKAQEILDRPGKTPTDACYECGFNSLSYFNRIFRRCVGLSPSQYKKKQLR